MDTARQYADSAFVKMLTPHMWCPIKVSLENENTFGAGNSPGEKLYSAGISLPRGPVAYGESVHQSHRSTDIIHAYLSLRRL
jgi:hypothetical protein